MEWEDRLDDWELELELSAHLEGSDWVTLERAAAETGASRAVLRTWYRSGQIPSRLVDGRAGTARSGWSRSRWWPAARRRPRGCGGPPSAWSPTRRSWRSCGTGSTSWSCGWRPWNSASRASEAP